MPNLIPRHVNQGFFPFFTNLASKVPKGGSTANKFLTNFNRSAYLMLISNLEKVANKEHPNQLLAKKAINTHIFLLYERVYLPQSDGNLLV
jgi:hypothetical protein